MAFVQPLVRSSSRLLSIRGVAPACARSMTAPVQHRPEEHPWLSKIKAPASFLPEERVLTFLAANVASGDIPHVARDWMHLPKESHAKGLEVILQAHNLAGFPRTINAMMKVFELGISTEGIKEYQEVQDIDAWAKDGDKTLKTVYGDVATKMRKNFHHLHPLMESIIVEHIYGRMLSRPVVGLRIREMVTLATVSGQDLPIQTLSHIRGCIRCGVTKEEVDSVIDQTGLVWGEKALKQVQAIRDEVWAKGKDKEWAAHKASEK
mmetsp:Transcript_72037/g.192501  ORF Transcript_72037/g.192501 Transcript_72037/m.192501 type:complete len:264 (-) Transcript_72037:330-1121(-)